MAAVLTVAACGVGGSSGTEATGSAEITDPTCSDYQQYGAFEGASVDLFTSIIAPEDQLMKDSWAEFERCTGITVDYEGSNDFEAALKVRVQGGNAPDIALVPQPGLLATLVAQEAVSPAPAAVEELVDANWSADWKAYGTVDGTFYAAPLGANVKSLVWYSPSYFEENGLTVPTTWDELIALSDDIAATGTKPWCAGFSSGAASGWPGTDWIEDVMLRTAGADVYDQWVDHEIPFDDAAVQEAFDTTGTILKNDDYVNGGSGGVKTINTTTFQNGGLAILDGTCALHRQASFYAAQWPTGTTVAEDGDVYAFYLPAIDADAGQPVLGAGEFVAAFNDDPAVQAFQTFLATSDWANLRAQQGSWVSANTGLDLANVQDPIQKLSGELLQDPETVFRFDGSDLMPAAVGSKSFWTGMINWINGDSTSKVTAMIESTWPD